MGDKKGIKDYGVRVRLARRKRPWQAINVAGKLRTLQQEKTAEIKPRGFVESSAYFSLLYR
jgi:ribosome-binding protein aMBF1 (putative translation factor)